jgi:hypothetical protein
MASWASKFLGGPDWFVGQTAKREAGRADEAEAEHDGRRKMAGKAGGLKGVALIGGGANSTVAGALHFFEDPSTSSRSLELCVTVFPMPVGSPISPLFSVGACSPVAARVHRGEGQGHGLDSRKAWIPHPRVWRHYQRLQLNRCAAVFAYYGCLFCHFCCRIGNTTKI